MADVLTTDMISDFAKVTSYNPTTFFSDYVSFTDTDYPAIVDYFNAVSTIYPTSSFQTLNSLTQEGKKIEGIMQANASALGNYEYWIVAEQIDDINKALETANNVSKWLRSSIVSNKYTPAIQVDYMAKQGQGIEDIQRDVLKSDDPENDWVDTAINNQLREEDYTLNGGYLIKVTYSNAKSINITTIVDNINTSDRTYGLDLSQVISIVSSDLQVLSYKDTAFQSALILGGLVQGDNPTYPQLGISRNYVGSNIASVSYPVLFRQLSQTFSTDDSFKNFAILDIKKAQSNNGLKVEDGILIEYSVSTRAGEVMKNIIQL